MADVKAVALLLGILHMDFFFFCVVTFTVCLFIAVKYRLQNVTWLFIVLSSVMSENDYLDPNIVVLSRRIGLIIIIRSSRGQWFYPKLLGQTSICVFLLNIWSNRVALTLLHLAERLYGLFQQ